MDNKMKFTGLLLITIYIALAFMIIIYGVAASSTDKINIFYITSEAAGIPMF